MIFVLADDHMLHVADSEEWLQGVFEGIDVEEQMYKFFDDTGSPLVADFTEPNKRGRVLGIAWVASGWYRLVPDRSGKLPHLLDMWETIAGLEKNPHFATLDDSMRHLMHPPRV